MYALFKDNEIVRVWVANADDSTYLNLKKGKKIIASEIYDKCLEIREV